MCESVFGEIGFIVESHVAWTSWLTQIELLQIVSIVIDIHKGCIHCSCGIEQCISLVFGGCGLVKKGIGKAKKIYCQIGFYF